MLAEEAGELHHVDGLFGAEDFGELLVGDDEALVLFVLAIVGFDVLPDLFDAFGAAELCCADDGFEFFGELVG